MSTQESTTDHFATDPISLGISGLTQVYEVPISSS